MKFIFKLLFYLFLFHQILAQTIYNRYIKQDEILRVVVDTYFTWVFSLPYDFQYKIYKEGSYLNFEGKNIGEEKILIKTSAIKNQRKIDIEKFKKEFFRCKSPFSPLENEDIPIGNSFLSFYHFCSNNLYYQLKSFIIYDNNIHLLYIIWTKNLSEDDQNRIRNFINNIQYKL